MEPLLSNVCSSVLQIEKFDFGCHIQLMVCKTNVCVKGKVKGEKVWKARLVACLLPLSWRG